MVHFLTLAALEFPRQVVDVAAMLSGLNDATEFCIRHIVPAAIGTHGVVTIVKRCRHY